MIQVVISRIGFDCWLFWGNLFIRVWGPFKTPRPWVTGLAPDRVVVSGVEALCVASGWLGWGAVGQHSCCSFWWAAVSPVFACTLGAGEQWRWAWSNWVYAGSFDLLIKASFSVTRLVPRPKGVAKSSSSSSRPSRAASSGTPAKASQVRISIQSSSEGWSSIFFEGVSNSEVHCGVIL